MKIAIRSTHSYFIARFKRKNIRRSNSRHYIHKSYLRFRFKRRCSNTYSQPNAVAFGRIIRHGISANGRFVISTFESKQPEFFPSRQILITYKIFINILIVIHGIGRNFYLCIRPRQEIHVLSFWQSNNKFFNEGSHIFIGDNLTLPFFYAKNTFRHFYTQFAFDFYLTTETPMVFLLLATEMYLLGRKNFATAFKHLTFALT